MRFARGFTVVEIVVVMTILTILTVLAVVGISGSQKNARDVERRIDAEAIAASLERFYNDGAVNRSTKFKHPAGAYPAQNLASNSDFLTYVLPGLPADAVKFSFASTSGFRVDSTSGNQAINSAVAIQRIDNDTLAPNITYQPITYVGNVQELCNTDAEECRAFKLYYREESEGALITIESKRQ